MGTLLDKSHIPLLQNLRWLVGEAAQIGDYSRSGLCFCMVVEYARRADRDDCSNLPPKMKKALYGMYLLYTEKHHVRPMFTYWWPLKDYFARREFLDAVIKYLEAGGELHYMNDNYTYIHPQN